MQALKSELHMNIDQPTLAILKTMFPPGIVGHVIVPGQLFQAMEGWSGEKYGRLNETNLDPLIRLFEDTHQTKLLKIVLKHLSLPQR